MAQVIKMMIKTGVSLTTAPYGLLKTAQAVKMSIPNGGVAEPIAIWSVMITPK